MVTAYILGGLLEDEVGCERVGVGGRAVEDQHPESRTDSFLFRSLCSAPSVPTDSIRWCWLFPEGKARSEEQHPSPLAVFIHNMMRLVYWYFLALLTVLAPRSWCADAFATSASSSGASASSSSPNENAICNTDDQSSQIFGIEASWSSPDWNWGSPFGLGHDCAMKCRRRFATQEQRRELVNSLVHADTDTQVLSNFEDVKMVLALAWQRGRKFDPDLEAFGQILDQMADLRYENGDDGEENMEGDRLLVQDLQKKYMWLQPGELSGGDLCVRVSKSACRICAVFLLIKTVYFRHANK